MVRICIVPNCTSGRSKDRLDRTKLGLRQLTVFSLPKCANKLKAWENVLGCTLAKDGAICQLHFLDKHIKKTDKTVLKNGMVHEMPRNRWILAHDAVPVPPGHPVMDPQTDLHLSVPEEAKINHTDISDENDIVTEQLCNPQIGTFESTQIEKIQSDLHAAQTLDVDVFTIDDIKHQLSSMILPEAWAWTKTSKGLKFTLYDRRVHVPKIHFEVTNDMFMTLITISARRIPLYPLTSMDTMCATFRSLETIQICDGTGMENERRSPHCFGILDEFEEYKRRRLTLRCDSCRNLRRNLQRTIGRTSPITEFRKVDQKCKIPPVKRKRIHITREAI